MDFKHKNHLISSYVTLQEQLQEVRSTICEGRPPTGNSASLTPLPGDTQSNIIDHLEKVNALFEQLAQRYIAAELQNMKKKQPVSATKMWASIQLRQLQENISDISPEVFERKFGTLDPEERAHIKEVIDQILQELKEAQGLV